MPHRVHCEVSSAILYNLRLAFLPRLVGNRYGCSLLGENRGTMVSPIERCISQLAGGLLLLLLHFFVADLILALVVVRGYVLVVVFRLLNLHRLLEYGS